MNGLVGLEIHTYLVTKEKLFCRCRASRERGLKPNVNICPICTGQPGAKPMSPNEEALKKSVMIALMLGCKVSEKSNWMRKHYSWPDLPKGYQTTISGSHAMPFAQGGEFLGIAIRSMHLEEDPASWNPQDGCVDYNRSGLPLVEIITEPEFHFAEEVGEWLKKLVHALSYLKIVDDNAGIKVDVNVNLISPKKTERVEIKNVNSIDSVIRAINYEFERQSREGSVRETRRFESESGKTMTMRSKEQAEDYRFISDPDLQKIIIKKDMVRELESKIPELPEKKIEKIVKKYRIDKKNAEILAKNLDIAEFFEKVAKEIKADVALKWVNVELLRVLNWNKKMLHEVDIKAEHFVELIKLVEKKAITELHAKDILNKFIPKSFMPSADKGRINDNDELEKVIKEVVKKNDKAVQDYKAGDGKALNFLMGEVMKATNKRADFKAAKSILEKILG